MRSEAGYLVILIELSIPLDSPFASRLSSSMPAFRPLSLQSAVDNGRTRDPFFHEQRRALRSESSAADVVDGGLSARAIPIRPSRPTARRCPDQSRAKAVCQPQQPLGDGALRPTQAGQKYTGRFANPVGSVISSSVGKAAIHCLGQRIASADPHRGRHWRRRCLSRRRSFGLKAAIAHSVSGDL